MASSFFALILLACIALFGLCKVGADTSESVIGLTIGDEVNIERLSRILNLNGCAKLIPSSNGIWFEEGHSNGIHITRCSPSSTECFHLSTCSGSGCKRARFCDSTDGTIHSDCFKISQCNPKDYMLEGVKEQSYQTIDLTAVGSQEGQKLESVDPFFTAGVRNARATTVDDTSPCRKAALLCLLQQVINENNPEAFKLCMLSSGYHSECVATEMSTCSCPKVPDMTVNVEVARNSFRCLKCCALLTADVNCEFATPDPPSVSFEDEVIVSLEQNGKVVLNPDETFSDVNATCGFSAETSQTSFTCEHIGSNSITAFISDVSGNSVSSTLNVIVEDNLAPELTTYTRDLDLDCTCNAQLDTDIYYVSDTMAYSCGIVFAKDNCFVESVDVFPTHFTGSDPQNIDVSVNVTDGSGNVAFSTATISLRDRIPPQITNAAPNLTVILEGKPGLSIVTLENLKIEATDNCDFTISLSREELTCNDVGVVTVTATVTDRDANTDFVDVDVTVLDIDKPIILNATNATAILNMKGAAIVQGSSVILEAEDNCAIQSLELSKSTFNCSDVGDNDVYAFAIDPSSNTVNVSAIVTVVDADPPTLIPKSVTTSLNSAGASVIFIASTNFPDVFVFDNCEVDTIDPTSISYDCADIGSVSETVTMTDVNGNSHTEIITVTVFDGVPPTISNVQSITVDLATTSVGVNPTQVASSSDNCNVDQFFLSPDTFDCGDRGSNTVHIVAIDDVGNEAVQTTTITVRDITEPNLTLAPYTAELDGISAKTISPENLIVSVSDNCDSGNSISTSVSPTAVSCSDIGCPVTVTVTATDTSSNSVTDSTTVTVEDVSGPDITSKDHTLLLDSKGDATLSDVDVVVSLNDNCDSNPSVTLSKVLYTCNDLGTASVTITSTDASGNVNTDSAVVTVADNIPPSLTTFSVRDGSLNDHGTFMVTPSDTIQTESDNCEVVDRTVLGDLFFTCDDIEIPRTITTTITDSSGNSQSGTTSFSVKDRTSPSISVVGDITAVLGSVDGLFFLNKENIIVSTSDNCEVDQVWLSRNTLDCSDLGDMSITASVNDTSGMLASATVFVRVRDGTAPSIQLSSGPYFANLNATQMVTLDVDDYVASSRDNCEVASIILTPSTFTCSDLGSRNVQIIAEDTSGNRVVSPISVTIQDNDNVCSVPP